MKIKAAVAKALNNLVVDNVELAPPKAGEVLVKMRAAGVCHSDLHTLRGELRAQPPIVLGHEGAGIVEEVGDGVMHVKVGDPVMINWLPACRTCPTCVQGHTSLCETFPSTVLQGLMRDGTSRLQSTEGEVLKQYLGSATMAEYAVVNSAGVIPIPADVPFDVAAIVGCAVMTGVGAVMNTAEVATGSSAAVIGCGGIGLSILLGLKMAGCYPIVAVDVLDSKLDLARELGATHTVNARNDDAVKAMRAATTNGPEYVFDSVGNAATIGQAIKAAAPFGTATITGMHGVLEDVPVPINSLIFQSKRLLGSFVGSARPQVDLPKLIELYRSGRLPLGSLISKHYALDDVSQAFEDMETGKVARGVIMFD